MLECEFIVFSEWPGRAPSWNFGSCSLRSGTRTGIKQDSCVALPLSPIKTSQVEQQLYKQPSHLFLISGTVTPSICQTHKTDQNKMSQCRAQCDSSTTDSEEPCSGTILKAFSAARWTNLRIDDLKESPMVSWTTPEKVRMFITDQLNFLLPLPRRELTGWGNPTCTPPTIPNYEQWLWNFLALKIKNGSWRLPEDWGTQDTQSTRTCPNMHSRKGKSYSQCLGSWDRLENRLISHTMLGKMQKLCGLPTKENLHIHCGCHAHCSHSLPPMANRH